MFGLDPTRDPRPAPAPLVRPAPPRKSRSGAPKCAAEQVIHVPARKSAARGPKCALEQVLGRLQRPSGLLKARRAEFTLTLGNWVELRDDCSAPPVCREEQCAPRRCCTVTFSRLAS